MFPGRSRSGCAGLAEGMGPSAVLQLGTVAQGEGERHAARHDVCTAALCGGFRSAVRVRGDRGGLRPFRCAGTAAVVPGDAVSGTLGGDCLPRFRVGTFAGGGCQPLCGTAAFGCTVFADAHLQSRLFLYSLPQYPAGRHAVRLYLHIHAQPLFPHLPACPRPPCHWSHPLSAA